MVDVFVPVEVAEPAAAGLFHKDRPRVVGAIIAGYTEGYAFEILLVGFGGFRRAPLEGGEFLLQIGIHRIAPGRLRPTAFPVDSPREASGPFDCPNGGAARGFSFVYSTLLVRSKTSMRTAPAADRGPAAPVRTLYC